MTPPLDEDPFFPPDWREQVREFLKPFEEEGLPFGSKYRLLLVQEQNTETPDELTHLHAAFQLGEITVELEGLYWYGMEEKTTVISSRKTHFRSPLHFWAYAMLIYFPLHDYDGPTNHLYFDFSREQRSHAINAEEFLATITRQWPHEQHSRSYKCTYPLPVVTQEPVLRAWHNSDNWNEMFEWAETSDSFILWCWRTFA